MMKFTDKLELAHKLKSTTHVVLFTPKQQLEDPISTCAVTEVKSQEKETKEDIKSYVSLEEAEKQLEEFIKKAEERKKLAEEKKKLAKSLIDTVKDQNNEAVEETISKIPGMVRNYCPPSPFDTQILIDDRLVHNVYSIDYAYIYNVDDRTPEEIAKGVPEDPYNVVGWITLMFFSPFDAATFEANNIRMINTNELGQTFDISIVDVHPVVETSRVAMDDILITKTIFFEAKDIIGRAIG